MLLEEIAKKLECTLIGDGNIEIKSVAGIKEAEKGDLTFIANTKYMVEIDKTGASAIIMSFDAPSIEIPTLRTDNPYLAFAKAIELFHRPVHVPSGIHPSAVISKTVTIGENPRIHACVVIGENVVLGNNITIYPNVTIYDNVTIKDNVIIHSNSVIRENTEIGNNVIIQNGVVIGGDGFGFAKTDDGTYYKIQSFGKVVIEDNVEIQSNSAVDRATVGNTFIAKGAKIDNLVQVAHGCSVGENSILCGLVGLAGSSTIGKNVILAGQVGVDGHISIGDNVKVLAKSGIVGSLDNEQVVSGMPAIDVSLWRRASICFSKLPELFKKFKKLEKTILDLKKAVAIDDCGIK